jgi:hypothetical protein
MRHNYVLKKEHVTPEIVSHADEVMYAWVDGFFILYNREHGLWKEYNIHSRNPMVVRAFNPELDMKNLVKEENNYNSYKTSAEIVAFLNELDSVKLISITMMDDLGLKVLDSGEVEVESEVDAIADWNEVEDDENPFVEVPDIKDIPLKTDSPEPEAPKAEPDVEKLNKTADEYAAALEKLYDDAEDYVSGVMNMAKESAEDWKEIFATEHEEKVIDKTSLIIGVSAGVVGGFVLTKLVDKLMK